MSWRGAVFAVVALCAWTSAGAAGSTSGLGASDAALASHRTPATRIVSGLTNPRIPAPIPPRVARYGSGVASAAENWSGYAQSASTGTYTAITGSFQVPTVDTSSHTTQYSSAWLGIGGDTDSTLIQAGVEADNLSGNALYTAWTEVLPQAEHPLRLAINPGDTVTVTIVETGKNVWKITVADTTTGSQASRKAKYKSSGASAEAILERPCVLAPCNSLSDLATLSPTTSVTFDLLMASTSHPSASPTYQPFMASPTNATLQDTVMLDNTGSNVIATPSDADADADGFTVADGTAVPPPPSS